MSNACFPNINVGSKSQSKFDVRSFPYHYSGSSYTTLMNYLIHLVETLLPLRDNIDQMKEVVVEQSQVSIDKKDGTNGYNSNITGDNEMNLYYKTNKEVSTYQDFASVDQQNKYKELTLNTNVTTLSHVEHPLQSTSNKKNVTGSNENLSKNKEILYGRYEPTKSVSKNRDGNGTNNNTEVMNVESNVLKQSLGNLQKSNFIPDDLDNSGSSTEISIQPYIGKPSKTLGSTFATVKERKRKQKQRKGKKHTHQENSRRKPNYNKTSTEHNNFIFSYLFSTM